MPSKKKCSLNCIRKKAEQIIQEEPLILPAMNVEQQQSLIHELHVHQIELKLQNEELITTQQRLERTRNKYSDLFNNAPVGYLILDRTGFILEANQTFADMAGYPANRVVKGLSAIFSPRRQNICSSASSELFSNHPRRSAWICN